MTAPAAAAAGSPYTRKPSGYRANPAFTVSYQGAGSWRTAFHARPANPGHKRDTNDARDSSTQAWKLTYRRALTIPACGAPSAGGPDPCEGLTGPAGARGTTSLTGKIDHKHVDGIFKVLNRKVTCSLRRRTRHLVQDSSVRLTYSAAQQTIGVGASGPVSTALSIFPNACPRQGDSIDRILDNYYTPGFSFDPQFGPDRWFTSREIAIPADVFHRSKQIDVRLADTRAGTPPRHCAVANPKHEQCTTRGSWSGVLSFKLK